MVKNYQLGKIYKIVCNITRQIYIGSTVEKYLSRRLVEHRHHYNQYLRGQTNFISSFEILQGENYDILLIENYPCSSSDELRTRERFHIENNKCVNLLNPIRTKEDNREKGKKYYYETIEHQSLRKKLFYAENKAMVDLRNKKYRLENSEKVKMQQRKYHESNKDAINFKKREKRRLKSLYLEQLKYYNL